MTFSLVGRCARTGMLGAAVTTSSIAVGSRCQHARAGVGAALTQHRTDPHWGLWHSICWRVASRPAKP
jgi:uncharacterized Ntn-hydrolase superfamily protein